MTVYRYSRWDGSQDAFGVDEDSILESLSDDILSHGDVNHALRSLFRQGVEDGGRMERIEGLHDLLERLKRQRQRQLDRYNLDSLFDGLEERIRDIVDTERRGIDRRLDEARGELAESVAHEEHLGLAMELLEQRARQSKETLDNLPDSAAGAVAQLRDYDFMDPEARRKFQDLLDMLNR